MEDVSTLHFRLNKLEELFQKTIWGQIKGHRISSECCCCSHVCHVMLLLSYVWLLVTPWTAACQASLSITNSWNLLKLMYIESLMPSNHLILCSSLLFPPSNFPNIRVFSNESTLCIKWPKYFSFSISPSNEHPGLISFRMVWLDSLQFNGLSRVFFNTTVQKHQFFSTQHSL